MLWKAHPGANDVIQAAFTADAPIARGTVPSRPPALGAALTCDSRWVGATSVETTWLRADAPIATGAGYTVEGADQGAYLTCRAKASNALGTTERASLPLVIPSAALPPAAPPVTAPGPPAVITPPRDIDAPRVAVFTKTRLTRRQFLAGVTVKLSADEPATIIAALRGRASRSRTTGPFTRPLGSRTLRGIGRRAITVRLKPNAAAVGKARSFSVRLHLTVTDIAGNRRITGKTIRVAG